MTAKRFVGAPRATACGGQRKCWGRMPWSSRTRRCQTASRSSPCPREPRCHLAERASRRRPAIATPLPPSRPMPQAYDDRLHRFAGIGARSVPADSAEPPVVSPGALWEIRCGKHPDGGFRPNERPSPCIRACRTRACTIPPGCRRRDACGAHVSTGTPSITMPRPAGRSRIALVESPVQTAQLIDEMRLIKNLLERQLAGFAWGEMAREAPTRAQLLGEMLGRVFRAA
jgi:flagellar biosynthesis protein FlhF